MLRDTIVNRVGKLLAFVLVFVLYTLVFVYQAPAPPPPPPPPGAPVGGEIMQMAAVGVVAAYGIYALRKRKK